MDIVYTLFRIDEMFLRYKFRDFSSWGWLVFVRLSLLGFVMFFRMGSLMCLLPGFMIGGLAGWQLLKEETHRLLKTFVFAFLSGFALFGISSGCILIQELLNPGNL